MRRYGAPLASAANATGRIDRKSTRLNSSHSQISYAVFCLKKKILPMKILSFEQIGLPTQVRELLHRPRGLVLVTGPTGSGKTTTLATMVDYINQNFDHHIV